MSSSPPRSSFASAVLLALTLLPVTGARAQSVEGRLADAEGAAVAGATMMLLDAAYETVDQDVTDAVGAFTLTAKAAGEHVVVAQLEGYASATSDPIVLAVGAAVRHDMVVQKRRVGESSLAVSDTLEGADLVARVVSDACRQEFLPAMHGILFGAVLDSATAEPVPGAEAVVTFRDHSGVAGAGTLRARANDVGIWLVCNAPAGRDLTVRAEAVGMVGGTVGANLRSGTMRKIDLRLALSDPDRPGAIFGEIVEQESGQPIAGAEIRIKDSGLGTVSNDRGIFRLPEVPGGLQVVTVEHLGHARREQAVRVLGGQAAQLEVRMSVQPIEMAPMLVTVRPRSWFSDMSGLEDRIAGGFGYIMTEKDLEEKQPRHLADALRNVPGVRVRQSGGTISGTYTIQIRNSQSIDGRACGPMVWVDGQKIGRDSSALTLVWGPDLYAVEVYRSVAETPGEFQDQEANCGTIVAWTKRGR